MKKKAVWTTGGLIFLVAFLLLWNTSSGGHGVVWQALSIFGLFNLACLIFGIGLVLTYPDNPNYVPPEKPPKKPKKRRKKKEVDVEKVLGVALKAAFLPAYMIYAVGAARRRRKKRKREEFWGGFGPWY